MIELLKEWQSLVSVVGGAIYGTWRISRALNIVVNHKHDKEGIAYLPEKIKI